MLLAAACALFAEYVRGQERMAALFGVVAGTVAAIGAALLPLGTAFGGMLVLDGPARFVRVLAAALAALWCLWVYGRGVEGGEREAIALALFSTAGAMFMASAAELMTLFLALEISTMPAYILVGYRKGDVRNLEGALKYFLMSLLTSLIALYGFSFVYGLSGTTFFSGFDGLARAETLGLLAAVLAIVGMSAKLSAVPFHYWAPDAYEGASPTVVAFVSTVPKLAGAIALVRLVGALSEGVHDAGRGRGGARGAVHGRRQPRRPQPDGSEAPDGVLGRRPHGLPARRCRRAHSARLQLVDLLRGRVLDTLARRALDRRRGRAGARVVGGAVVSASAGWRGRSSCP